jgi:hypothetical protein
VHDVLYGDIPLAAGEQLCRPTGGKLSEWAYFAVLPPFCSVGTGRRRFRFFWVICSAVPFSGALAEVHLVRIFFQLLRIWDTLPVCWFLDSVVSLSPPLGLVMTTSFVSDRKPHEKTCHEIDVRTEKFRIHLCFPNKSSFFSWNLIGN